MNLVTRPCPVGADGIGKYEAELLGIANELEDLPSMRGHLNVVQERRMQVADYRRKAHDTDQTEGSPTIKVAGALTGATITRLPLTLAMASAARGGPA